MRRAGEPRAFIEARVRIEDRGYSTPCWVWQKCLTEKGYARAQVPGYPRLMRVHRAAYELYVGPIPEGLTLDHLCCVKSCCNPHHLEPVTAIENWRRAAAIGRGGGGTHSGGGGPGPQRKTHCACGTELTPENRAKGHRAKCKPCWAAYMSEWNKANLRSDSHRNEYKRLWKQRRKAKARAELSGGTEESSDTGFDALQLRNAFSSASPLDWGL